MDEVLVQPRHRPTRGRPVPDEGSQTEEGVLPTSRVQDKLVPHLWYTTDAEEAARFYTTVFPDSHVDFVTHFPADSPSGPAGGVAVVWFTLFGQRFVAISGGPHHPFNDAVSFLVLCDSQDELDRYWDAFVGHGGTPQACGWIVDRYGVRWQVAPRRLHQMLEDPDPGRAGRVAAEMLKQVKFDLATLEAAYHSE
jgi:predicted 3-demethylubiquinone-9 3-methyltransferase (glyoxalase superfamily)